jgi:hypothetical protein
MDGLVPDTDAFRTTVEETLEALTAHGDLLEQRDIAADQEAPIGSLLYAAPPSFVCRESGAVIILGIAPDRLSPLPDELETHLEFFNHVRRLPASAVEDLPDVLSQLGFIELSFEAWLRAPPAETAAQHLARLKSLLSAERAAREIPGLTVIEPENCVRYYKGRWVQPRAQTGRFVGRRNQAYGADLWCHVELESGKPLRFLDLPLRGSRARGCDEAWRLQAAIDTLRGAPQQFRVRRGSSKTRIIDLFSPVPMWARRRWDALGQPIVSSGCLFSYSFPEDEIEQELRFARENLWLTEFTQKKKT